MANMTLGGYAFPWNPDQFTEPRSERYSASIPNYGAMAFFSWGLLLPGKLILLEWNWMQTEQWDQLKTLYEADAALVWVPGNGNSYQVEILALEGSLPEVVSFSALRRENVRMTLVLLNQI